MRTRARASRAGSAQTEGRTTPTTPRRLRSALMRHRPDALREISRYRLGSPASEGLSGGPRVRSPDRQRRAIELGFEMPIVEYKPGTVFPGVIGRTADESSPAWPAPTRAPKGTPNVLFIVLDDTGFGQLGCFGGAIETPNLDALASNGLRYNNMHTTALCSPSRSCIVTGRNHHSNAMACITEFATGYPGYDGNVPFENGYLSEILLAHGYNTYMVGKWHLIPASQETAAGPYDRWPLGTRIRTVLWLPRRRHEPVESRPGLRQPPGRAARDAGSGLPPDA